MREGDFHYVVSLLSGKINFDITYTLGVVGYSFALRVRENISPFAPLGYTDYRIRGFRPSSGEVPNTIGSNIGITRAIEVIPLTLISFTEKGTEL